MPGHVNSWAVGYPELASAPGPYQIERRFGVFDAAFDPTRESTYKFIDGFIGEMVRIFPDPYWHIGGDENNGKQWAANPAIQAFMKKKDIRDAHALQTYFNQRLLEILKKYKKRMMGWDEIFQPGLPKPSCTHGADRVALRCRGQGYDGVLSAGTHIDLLETLRDIYAIDPLPAGAADRCRSRAHPRRRGDHVGRMGGAGDHRVAHLYARRR
jgi:hexosaminidase